ncbi:MAG TPA: hypothetical protein VJV75_04265 [Candidatus Polarisedimenticolia bacterium]|nr:hypothetical protein [Candidatus Polarisedimenticolia bacterium]
MFWSLAAVAFLVRLAVLWATLAHPEPQKLTTVPDSDSYIECGGSLAEHGAIVDADGKPAWGRTPGYPAFLALTFLTGLASPDRLAGALVVQALIASMTVALAARMASLFGGIRIGLIVGALLILEPSGISYSNLILTETLYTFALLIALLAFWRWLSGPGLLPLAWFAVLVAVLPLIRPIALHLPWLLLPIVAWCAPRRLRLKSAALFLALALLPSAAWTARNWRHFGIPVLDQTGPLAKALFARQVELRAGAADAASGSEKPSLSDHPWNRYYAERGALLTAEAMRRQEEYFRTTLRAHPRAALEEWVYIGAAMIGSPDIRLQAQLAGLELKPDPGNAGARLERLRRTGPLLPVILLGIVISLGGVALLPVFAWNSRRWPASPRSFAIMMTAVVVYHLVLSSFVRWQGERYRVPIVPCLAIVLLIGASGVATAARRLRAPAVARPHQTPDGRMP